MIAQRLVRLCRNSRSNSNARAFFLLLPFFFLTLTLSTFIPTLLRPHAIFLSSNLATIDRLDLLPVPESSSSSHSPRLPKEDSDAWSIHLPKSFSRKGKGRERRRTKGQELEQEAQGNEVYEMRRKSATPGGDSEVGEGASQDLPVVQKEFNRLEFVRSHITHATVVSFPFSTVFSFVEHRNN